MNKRLAYGPIRQKDQFYLAEHKLEVQLQYSAATLFQSTYDEGDRAFQPFAIFHTFDDPQKIYAADYVDSIVLYNVLRARYLPAVPAGVMAAREEPSVLRA